MNLNTYTHTHTNRRDKLLKNKRIILVIIWKDKVLKRTVKEKENPKRIAEFHK